MKKCTHGAFRIRTDKAYVRLQLINCFLIILALQKCSHFFDLVNSLAAAFWSIWRHDMRD